MSKPIRFHRRFEKHFAKRVLPDTKLCKQFDERYKHFVVGKQDYPLDDHSLSGLLTGKRAFSIANDVRVIYIENNKEIVFLDIGSHNQVYR